MQRALRPRDSPPGSGAGADRAHQGAQRRTPRRRIRPAAGKHQLRRRHGAEGERRPQRGFPADARQWRFATPSGSPRWFARPGPCPAIGRCPIVFNEDDHYAFDQPANNLLAALGEHASWGYFDGGENNYQDGYQSPPVRWGINTPRKRASSNWSARSPAQSSNPQARSTPASRGRRKSPVEAGFDPGKLATLAKYIGGIGCVVKDGYLVFTWGGADRRVDVASCLQTLVHPFSVPGRRRRQAQERRRAGRGRRAATGRAERGAGAQGSRHSLAAPGHRKRPATASASGPGRLTTTATSTWRCFSTALLRSTARTTTERARSTCSMPRLTDVLGCEDEPRFNASGRLAISPRDFARFGLLYLREGNWRGRQLLTAEHVRHDYRAVRCPNDIPRTKRQPGRDDRRSALHRGRQQPDRPSGQLQLRLVDQRRRPRTASGIGPRLRSRPSPRFGHDGKRAMVVIPSQRTDRRLERNHRRRSRMRATARYTCCCRRGDKPEPDSREHRAMHQPHRIPRIARQTPPDLRAVRWPKRPRSAELYARAVNVFPGGVTHDTRYLQPHPLYIDRAAGSRKWDVDGNEYVDYIGGHGALLLGHNHPQVTDAVREQLGQGHSLRRQPRAGTAARRADPADGALRRQGSLHRLGHREHAVGDSRWPGPLPASARSCASPGTFTAGTTRWPSPLLRTSTARCRPASCPGWPAKRSSARRAMRRRWSGFSTSTTTSPP